VQARYDRFHIVMEIHAVECRLCAMHGYVRVNFLHCNRTTELYVCSYGDLTRSNRQCSWLKIVLSSESERMLGFENLYSQTCKKYV